MNRGHRQELWEGSEPRPQGKTPLERPRLEWQMRPKSNVMLRRVQLTLNEKPIPTRYDRESATVIGELTDPAPLGVCKVFCEVWLSNDRGIEMEWEFTRVPLPPPAPSPDSLQQELVRQLNQLRRALPLPDTTLDAPLCLAATLHSRYLQLNRLSPLHEEDPSRAGFAGRTPAERAEKAGSFLPCYEVIVGGGDPRRSMQTLIDAPYHRSALLQPGSFRVGAGVAGDRTTVLCSQSSAQEVIVYPADGQLQVPLQWVNTELPNPLRLYSAPPSTLGYPITFHVFGITGKLQLKDARLTTAEGTEVAFFLNTPMNDDELDDTILLLPKMPLASESTYRVRVAARSPQGTDIVRAWQFTTEKASPPPKPPTSKIPPRKKTSRGDLRGAERNRTAA